MWYAQFLWPIFKSKVPGGELAADGPVVREHIVIKSKVLAEPTEEQIGSGSTCEFMHHERLAADVEEDGEIKSMEFVD